MSGLLVFGCGDVNETGDDDDDDSADASVTIDGSGDEPDAAGGDPDAAGGGTDAARPDPDGGEPVFCGGFGGVTCSKSEWCDYDAGCGFDDGGGTCEPRPEACPDIFAPVCGCDFRTYGNACEANASGQDVLHDGACKGDPGGGGGSDPGSP